MNKVRIIKKTDEIEYNLDLELFCPFCGKTMETDTHINCSTMDNWICTECKSLKGKTVCICPEDISEIICTEPSKKDNY